MPEDPIAHGELAALTRRHEQAQDQTTREFGIIKSELTTLQLKVSNLDQKVDSLRQDIGDFIAEQRKANATVVELLATMAGKTPDA
ncbi:hypothetical protein [Streptomyces sp. NBC_01205]|uniref:hypothetical protein n=1 Tax=Streptomyces sp. NBC_01205 TaxID=2903771 RepID=UPI002E0E56B9|nr:hypothetical protein OG573_43345 [Streptomyces sp. NBC_01205]